MKDTEAGDAYQELMRKEGERLKPKGWEPLMCDGRVVAWVQVKLPTKSSLKQAFAYLACGFGRKPGKS